MNAYSVTEANVDRHHSVFFNTLQKFLLIAIAKIVRLFYFLGILCTTDCKQTAVSSVIWKLL